MAEKKNNLSPLNKVSLLAYLINLGISIPHYCYHNNLSIAGNCRICIVEMANLNKPIVSCAVSAGTSLFNHEIYHNSGLVKKARENVMEFLLLNHPLDCPICDQGGECDLQDQSLFFGFTKRRFYKFKRITLIMIYLIIISLMQSRHQQRLLSQLETILDSLELRKMRT